MTNATRAELAVNAKGEIIELPRSDLPALNPHWVLQMVAKGYKFKNRAKRVPLLSLEPDKTEAAPEHVCANWKYYKQTIRYRDHAPNLPTGFHRQYDFGSTYYFKIKVCTDETCKRRSYLDYVRVR